MKTKTRAKLRVVKEPSPGLALLIDDYLSGLHAKGSSLKTIDGERAALQNLFLPWATKRGVTGTDQLTQATIDHFSRYLLEEHLTPKGKPLSRESVRTYLRPIRELVRGAQRSGDLGEMVVKLPPAPKRVLDVLNREEIRDIEDAAKTERDKLIVRLLADLGLRLGELLGLRTDDLIRAKEARFVRVRGKGNKERVIPIAPKLFERLDRYARRPQSKHMDPELDDRIFTTERKRGDYYSPLAGRTVNQMIRFAAQDAGIKKRVYPHLFRHSNATHQLNEGVPIKHIQENLGHADLSMLTNVYSHITPNDRYESMLKLIRKDEDSKRR